MRVPLLDLCSTGVLRLLSALNFSFLNFVLVLLLLRRRRAFSLFTSKASGQKLSGSEQPTSAHVEQLESLAALTAVHLPVLWFSSALYYTDAASCASVLLLFCLADPLALSRVRRSEGVAITQQLMQFPILLVGGVSLLLRQTNICWQLLLFLLSAARVAMQLDLCAQPVPLPVREYSFGAVVRSLLFCPFAHQIRFAYTLFRQCWAYITLGCWFVAFVFWNGGSVVLGDRDAHRPKLHLAQPLYLLAFAAAAVLPQLLHRVDRPAIRRLSQWALQHKSLVALAFLAAAGCVHFGTLAHRYLLADNRHYTFYLWKNVLSKPVLRYSLLPGYLLAGVLLVDALYSALRAQSDTCVAQHLNENAAAASAENTATDTPSSGPAADATSAIEKPKPKSTTSTPTSESDSNQSLSRDAGGDPDAASSASSSGCSDQIAVLAPGVRLLAMCVCAAVSVALQELLEFRYFIVPCVLVRVELHALAWPTGAAQKRRSGALSMWPTLCELVLYLAVDAGTLYLFLYRPFRWTNDPKHLQRFMW